MPEKPIYTPDGGPAFPVQNPRQWPGMKLIDWYTGQALQGFCSNQTVVARAMEGDPEAFGGRLAELAFSVGRAATIHRDNELPARMAGEGLTEVADAIDDEAEHRNRLAKEAPDEVETGTDA